MAAVPLTASCVFSVSMHRGCSHNALFEISSEGGTLGALRLPVLHGHASQMLVHHDGVDGRRPLLIIGGGLAQPVMDVIGEGAASLVCLRCSRYCGISGYFWING